MEYFLHQTTLFIPFELSPPCSCSCCFLLCSIASMDSLSSFSNSNPFSATLSGSVPPSVTFLLLPFLTRFFFATKKNI